MQEAHPASETDAELVRRARRGDADAFERLVRRHLRASHAVARRLVDDHADADDVVQDSFLRALERLEDCRDPARFRSWLLSIVRNRAHNVRERQTLRRGIPLESVAQTAGGPDPSRRVEDREFHDALHGALAGLTELQRNVFVAYDMEGLDHAEVAERLEISPASSRFNLHVARRALRDRLGARYPWPGDGDEPT